MSNVHGLSPLKQGGGGKSYLYCILLQGKSTAKRKAVCFSPRKHKVLSPVKLFKIGSNNDAILGDRFLVSLLGKATFDSNKRFLDDSILTLNDFYGLAPGQIVKLECLECLPSF